MDLMLVTEIATELAGARPGWSAPRYVNAGASGAVFEVTHPVHGRVALKIYDPRFFEGDNALIETDRIQLQSRLTGLHHPNLIRTIETGPIARRGTWYLLMEYLPWPDLSDRIADVPDARVAALIAQLAEVVLFLKQHGLVHRDIKPANIGIAPDFSTLKLLDLGVLRRVTPEGAGTDADGKKRFVATAQYSPPEYLIREEPPGEAGFDALNVYQVGAVLHDLIMKRPLFADAAASLNKYVLHRAIEQKQPFLFNAAVPAPLVSICRAALNKDPVSRIAAVGLEHFITAGEDTDAVRRRLSTQGRAAGSKTAPSVTVWRNRVRDWVMSAAAAERDALGAFSLAGTIESETGACLRFDRVAAALTVRLLADERAGTLRLLLGSRADGPAALEITNTGSVVPNDQIVFQLRGQLLNALDALPSASGVDER